MTLTREIDIGSSHRIDVLLPAISNRDVELTSASLKLDFNGPHLARAIGRQKNSAYAAAERHDTDGSPENLVVRYQEKQSLSRLEHRLALLHLQRMPLLTQLGVDSIEILGGASEVTIELGLGSRQIRILDLFHFSPADFERLLPSSGQLTLATGDRSWSQAVSAHTTILYEMGSHKENLVRAWRSRLVRVSVVILRASPIAWSGRSSTDRLGSGRGVGRERLRGRCDRPRRCWIPTAIEHGKALFVSQIRVGRDPFLGAY